MNPLEVQIQKQQALWADPFLHLTEVALYRKRMQLEDLREAAALRREVAQLTDNQLRIYNQDEKTLDNDPVYHGSVDERVRLLIYGRALPQQVYEAILAEEGKPAESMADVGVAMVYGSLPPSRKRVARKLFWELKILFPPLKEDRYLISSSVEDRIGYALLDYRKERRLTQKEVAQHLGLSASTLSRLETGNWVSNLEEDKLSAIATLLGFPLEIIKQKMAATRQTTPQASKQTSESLSLEQHEFLRLYRHLPKMERDDFLKKIRVKTQESEEIDNTIRIAAEILGQDIPEERFRR